MAVFRAWPARTLRPHLGVGIPCQRNLQLAPVPDALRTSSQSYSQSSCHPKFAFPRSSGRVARRRRAGPPSAGAATPHAKLEVLQNEDFGHFYASPLSSWLRALTFRRMASRPACCCFTSKDRLSFSSSNWDHDTKFQKVKTKNSGAKKSTGLLTLAIVSWSFEMLFRFICIRICIICRSTACAEVDSGESTLPEREKKMRRLSAALSAVRPLRAALSLPPLLR